jgi:RND superfamily putative drug exporter
LAAGSSCSTLVPALLGLLGDRINALRIPVLGRVVDSAGREGRFWSAIARVVTRRPVMSLVASVVLLLAAAAPVLDLRLSGPGIRSFPDDAPSKAGFVALEKEFGVGTVDSAIVAVEGDVTAPPLKSAVQRLVRTLAPTRPSAFRSSRSAPTGARGRRGTRGGRQSG